MADNTILVFKCLNPECGQLVKLKRPQKSGIYPITCPYCKNQKKMSLKGRDAFDTIPDPLPVLDNSSKPAINLKEDFITGELYKIKCPHGCNQELGLKFPKAGHKEFSCPKCKGKLTADVRDKTEIIDDYIDEDILNGKLVLIRKGWLNKNYPLKEGSYTVGRYDEAAMSDISIKHDNSISRRSLRIDVEKTKKGMNFKMTVLKATNPVLLNGSKLSIGESVSLNFGDLILIGKTKLRFDIDQ